MSLYEKDHHHFQRAMCVKYNHLRPILNAASKEDPGNIDQYGPIHLDCVEKDVFTGIVLKDKLKNFVLGSVFDMNMFEDRKFGLIILGEWLEHTTQAAARKGLLECRRVLKDDGRLVLTFPKDHRPPEKQHGEGQLFTWVEGVTSWHQTVWEDNLLLDLFKDTCLIEQERVEIGYGHSEGLGLVLSKSS